MSCARNAKQNRRTKTAPDQLQTLSNKEYIQEVLQWLLKSASFQDCQFHGNTSWLPIHLCVQALLWVWSPAKSVTKAFEEAAAQSKTLLGRAALSTFQGMMNALLTWTPSFMDELQLRLHELIAEVSGLRYRKGRWVAIAADGSRGTTPRTKSNEQAFCARNYGKGKTAKYRKKKSKGLRRRRNKKNKPQPQAPQIWITLMWHMGLGVPWCWKLGPSDSSERQHVMDLLETAHFAERTLFVADAGFVGYDFWNAILSKGHHFLVRVGGNVRLLEGLGYQIEKRQGIVYCWPSTAMKKNLPPLKLRLVKCVVGNKKMSLLTSVLDKDQLTDHEVAQLYKDRWGVELEFRCLKQTFERRKLRSHNSERALVELEWSIFGMAVLELFALREQSGEAHADPMKLSFAQTLNAFRTALQNLGKHSTTIPDLATALRTAVIDDYERKASKAARYKCTRKTKPSCGDPIITVATIEQRKLFKTIEITSAI